MISSQPLQTLKCTNQRIWSIDWHPKQPIIASVGSDKNIKLWKQQANGEWIKTQTIMTEHLKTIRCVKFSNKGDKIAICSFDATISIFILSQDGYQFLTELAGHQNEVKSIDWHQTDQKLASCSRDKNIWIWSFNATTYEYQCENILQGHTNDIKCVKWLDYSTLGSGSYDDTIRIWTQNDEEFEQDQVLKGHQNIIWSMDYSESMKMLASVSSDLSVILWERSGKGGKFVFWNRIQILHSEPIYSVLLIDNVLLTGAGDNTVRVGKIVQGKYGSGNKEKKEKENIMETQSSCYQQISALQHANDVNCIRSKFLKDKTYQIASCSDDQTIKIWELKL